MNPMYYNVRYDDMVLLPYFDYFTQASPTFQVSIFVCQTAFVLIMAPQLM